MERLRKKEKAREKKIEKRTRIERYDMITQKQQNQNQNKKIKLAR